MAKRITIFVENPTTETVAYYSPYINVRRFRHSTVGAFRTVVEVDADKVDTVIAEIRRRWSFLKISITDVMETAREPVPIPEPPVAEVRTDETASVSHAVTARRSRKHQQQIQPEEPSGLEV